MTSSPRGTPVKVSEVLPAALPGLVEHLRAAAIRRQWTALVGEAVGRHSRPDSLRQGVLGVIVDSSPWLQELTLRSEEILRLVQARHGAAVTAVRFALGRIAAPSGPVDRGTRAAQARLGAEDRREIDRLAASVTDPELTGALRRIMTKDWLARAGRGGTTWTDGRPEA